MCLLGKKQILFAHDFLAAVHTAEKLRHQSLLRHSAKLKNAPHQPRIQLRIQKGFHSQVKKIHHILLIRPLMSEVIRKLQEIISIVDSRLPGCQFHKMMGHGHLVQIVAAAPLKKGKIPEYKGIGCCHKWTVLPSCPLCKSGNFSPLPGKKNDPLVILSHGLGR